MARPPCLGELPIGIAPTLLMLARLTGIATSESPLGDCTRTALIRRYDHDYDGGGDNPPGVQELVEAVETALSDVQSDANQAIRQPWVARPMPLVVLDRCSTNTMIRGMSRCYLTVAVDPARYYATTGTERERWVLAQIVCDEPQHVTLSLARPVCYEPTSDWLILHCIVMIAIPLNRPSRRRDHQIAQRVLRESYANTDV